MAREKLRRRAVIIVIVLAGALAPVRFSATTAPAEAAAECTTCCPDPGSTCVVCAEDCIKKKDAYDNGGGKCQNES